jgi:hypothetical protein
MSTLLEIIKANTTQTDEGKRLSEITGQYWINERDFFDPETDEVVLFDPDTAEVEEQTVEEYLMAVK